MPNLFKAPWKSSAKFLLMAGVGLSLGVPALAQSEAQDSGKELGDIVVTAQKRTQSAQDVAIAMSVVPAAVLKNSVDIANIATFVPGVQVNYGLGLTAFNIRGIGVNEFAGNFDSPVAVHIDEVYLSKAFMNGLMLFDLDRVEVLKGPQGTLFGRNTTGGAVNFYTAQPTRQFHVGGKLGYDNYQTLRTEAYVSGPLTNTLSARVSGFITDQGKGFYRNQTLGGREGAERKGAVRGQLLWDNGSDKLHLTVNYGKDKSIQAPYDTAGVFTPESLAAGTPAFCAEYLNGTVTSGTANCVRGSDGANSGDNDPFTSRNNLRHRVNNTGFGTTLRAEHDLDWATLTSISSYQYFKRDFQEDSAGDPIYSYDVYAYNTIRQFTQEVRLTSNKDGIWHYVVGGFYEHDIYKNNDYLDVANGNSAGYFTKINQKMDALAIFVHNDISVTDTLSIIAGARYTNEKLKISGGTYAGTGLSANPESPTEIVATLSTADAIVGGNRRRDKNMSFKVGFEWKPQIDMAWIDKAMVYAHASTGFRSGGFNAQYAAPQAAFTSLSPEKLTAYEAGFKTTLFNRSLELNGAVFHYDFEDGVVNIDSSTTPFPISINAASIRSDGAELEARWRPVGGLTLSGGVSWLDSRVTSDITSGGQSLRGFRPVNAPKWTVNSQALYEVPLNDAFKLVLGADASYRSSQYFEVLNAPSNKEAGYWLANAQVTIAKADDRWALTGWVRNLANTRYRTYINDLPGFGWVINIFGPPRTYGATASFKF